MKVKAAIIGSGNIGTDLVYKALRSEWIDPVWMVGIDPASDGLKRAAEHGSQDHRAGRGRPAPAPEGRRHPDRLRRHERVRARGQRAQAAGAGVLVIDLTPAAIGPYCIPPVNLAEHVGTRAMNVNMVSCGGQATIPIVAAVSRVQAVEYAEIVATVASRSAGPGTRKNIDEFTRTTARRGRERRRREARQGDHHPQPGRAAADHARHRPLPDGGRARRGGASPTRSTR